MTGAERGGGTRRSFRLWAASTGVNIKNNLRAKLFMLHKANLVAIIAARRVCLQLPLPASPLPPLPPSRCLSVCPSLAVHVLLPVVAAIANRKSV